MAVERGSSRICLFLLHGMLPTALGMRLRGCITSRGRPRAHEPLPENHVVRLWGVMAMRPHSRGAAAQSTLRRRIGGAPAFIQPLAGIPCCLKEG